ncbi:MAG: DNA primase [Gammaproteobacteria bacterium]|nr:DNA primase [Gammaproteobacteria bacterium]MCH9743989.1 DNA primase [Gammaproteobacteria bacterium]
MGGLIPQSFIQEVVSRTDIIEAIQARIQLKKKGKNYQALCPFHEEKSPSFSANQDKQFYYCFGCGAHGNVVSFLMQYDHMEFRDCIEHLAHKLGLELPKESSNEKAANTSHLYPIMEKANHFYQKMLRKSPHAIEFLKGRGLTGEVAKQFSIGYALDSWDALLRLFNNDKDAISALLTTGMIIKKDLGKQYDRFRNRIIFPIHDTRGRVIGFGGRSLDDQLPKYLNSPETPIYHKGNELYGLYESRQQQANPKCFIIVEGYMDVISLHQHDIPFAVATLGTAVNVKHIQKLLRYSSELIFCFDGDTAGKQAMWKALTICIPMLRDGIHMRFCYMPNKHDPDSFVREVGKDAFMQHIQSADTLQNIFFNALDEQFDKNTIDGKAHYSKQASQYIQQMPKGLYQQLMLKRLAEELDVELSTLQQIQQPSQKTVVTDKIPDKQKPSNAYRAIALLLHFPVLAQQSIDLTALFNLNVPGKELLVQILMLLRKRPETTVGELLTRWEDTQERSLIANLAARKIPFTEECAKVEFEDVLKRLINQHNDIQVKNLIEKARQQDLTDEEKQQLQQLLSKKDSAIQDA